jgi:PAS domain S-box-containing protein
VAPNSRTKTRSYISNTRFWTLIQKLLPADRWPKVAELLHAIKNPVHRDEEELEPPSKLPETNSRWDLGPSLDRGLLIGIVMLVVLLISSAAITYQNTQRLKEHAASVARIHEVLDLASETLRTLLDAATGQQGFVVTGKEQYLQPYYSAASRLDSLLTTLQEKTADNPAQQERVRLLKALASVRMHTLETAIGLRRKNEGGLEPFLSVGKAQMDEIRELINDMEQQERDLLQKQQQLSRRSYAVSQTSHLLTAAVGLLMVGAVYWLLLRSLSARQKAAQAIYEQRQWFEKTLASIGDAVIVADAQGRVTFLNSVAQTLTGWREDQAKGQPLDAVCQIVSENPRKLLENPVTKVLVSGRIVGLSNRALLIDRSRTRRPIDDCAAPIKDQKGRVVGVVLVLRDITDRRRVEEALRRQTAQLQEQANQARLLDHAHLIIRQADGRILFWNSGAAEMYGFSKEEAEGQLSHSLLQAVFPKPLEEINAELLRYGNWQGELVHTRKDGSTISVASHWALYQDEQGQPARVLEINNEATEIDRLRESLRQSEVQFRQLADAMPQIVWAARPDGFCDYYNQRWYEYTGFARGEYGQQSWEQILHPDDLERSVATYLRCIQAEQPYQIEYRFKDRHSGGYRWFLGRALPARDESGCVIRWFGTCTDIDDTKNAQEALKEADRRKDEFLATLAHELRNPIAPIRNAVELVRRADGDAALIEQARNIMERQLSQMVRLVDDLLDISRITTGKLQLRRERVELVTVVQSAAEAVRPLIDAQAHELTVALPQEPVYLDADPTRLAQVISNLLSNAAKFTDKGGHIWLTAQRQDGDVVLSVQDTGIGISAEDLPHIFEIFSQVAPALERSQGGLGIGLSLVRGFVELHGGNIQARSAGLGKGSEFSLRLPVVERPAPQALQPGTRQHQQSRCVPKSRILVVEDNRDSADSLALLLRLMGYDTHTAQDGFEAVQTAATIRPEVILLDIGLPRMNGYEAARCIRNQVGGTNIVLIALTGWGQEEDKRRAIAAGFDHHLTKPLDPAALENLLATLTLKRLKVELPGKQTEEALHEPQG